MDTTIYLVIGADGLIGNALVNELLTLTPNVFCTSRQRGRHGSKAIFFDLSESSTSNLYEDWIKKITERGRLIVFICAAITRISDCEEDPIRSYLINVTNTVELGKKLMYAGADVLYLSSSAVFNGLKPLPKESSKPDPYSNYGRQKAETEMMLLAINKAMSIPPSLMIVRLTKVISRLNPLIDKWIDNLCSGNRIDAFKNSMIAPISLGYATRKIIEIATRGVTGTYHVSGSKDLSYYDFATMMASELCIDKKLVTPEVDPSALVNFERKYSALGSEWAESSLDLGGEDPQMVVKSLFL